jgi:hypothetical protein
VRSDLLAQYRRSRETGQGATLAAPPENYAFDDHLVYGSARGAGGRLITRVRKLLNPVLKLFINPNPIIHVLHRQSAINTHFDQVSALNYEVMHNLVVELTRLGIEVKNLKMRVESLSGRLDFSDRRARALESVVQYRPGTGPAAERAETAVSAPVSGGSQGARREGDAAGSGQGARRESDAAGSGGPVKGEAQRARRRRRRRGRTGAAGQPLPGGAIAEGSAAAGNAADDGVDAPAEGGRGGDGLPFDGGAPGPAEAPARGAGEPTDQ